MAEKHVYLRPTYIMLLLHAIILYLPSWCGGRKIFTSTAESLSSADVSVSIQTCFFSTKVILSIIHYLIRRIFKKVIFLIPGKILKKCTKIDWKQQCINLHQDVNCFSTALFYMFLVMWHKLFNSLNKRACFTITKGSLLLIFQRKIVHK